MKLKKINLTLFIFLGVYGCVPQTNIGTVPTPTATPLVSPTPSSVPSLSPSLTPSSSATPVIIPTPAVTPVLTPSPTSTPEAQILQSKNFSIGINNPYIKITDKILSDYQRESTEVNKDIQVLNTNSFIIDLHQELVDFESTKEGFLWTIYDNILENYKDKNVSIYFRLKYRDLLDSTTITQRARYIEFISKTAQRYQDYNISWIIGDKVNDKSYLPVSQKEFVDFITLNANNIKVFTPKAKIFLGSLVQSEIFGKTPYYTADNLLSYINLGADKICDGFILEVYSLDVNNLDPNSSSPFRNTNYNLIKKYYDSVTDILNRKGIKDKKLYLVTSTFGGELVDQALQTELDQANDLFRRIIFSNTIGFDKTFISQLYDSESTDPSSFYKRLGISIKDSTGERKKISYWMYKFIAEKLNNTKFSGYIPNLPVNIKGFIFESDSKKYYVLWNQSKNYTDNIEINIDKNEGTLFITPNDNSTLGISNFFTIAENNKKANISFNSFNLSPRVIEVNK